jgi:pimeloyl-ACP methyl ester carboxylesterase
MPFANLTDVRCRYEITGSGDPLLMIAGLGSTCETFVAEAEYLSKHFSVIRLDNRLMGQSVGLRPPQGLDDLSADCIELIDYLQLDRTHILGLSLGGIIAQRLAIDHPSRIDRLVLVSCANRFGPYLRQMARLLELSLRRFPFSMFRSTVEALACSPEYFDAHDGNVSAAIDCDSDAKHHRAAIARQLRCLGCQEIAPPNEYRILSPTLVISGESDMLIPTLYARRMANEIPGSEFISIPKCGHDPMREKPGLVLPRIVEFLSRSDIRRSFSESITEVSSAMEVMH